MEKQCELNHCIKHGQKVTVMLNVAALAFTSFAEPSFAQLLAAAVGLRLNEAGLLTLAKLLAASWY